MKKNMSWVVPLVLYLGMAALCYPVYKPVVARTRPRWTVGDMTATIGLCLFWPITFPGMVISELSNRVSTKDAPF